MMKRFTNKWVLSLVVFVLYHEAFSQAHLNPSSYSQARSAGFNTSSYEAWTYTRVKNNTTENLPFRMLKPVGYTKNHSPYPLVVMLHGRGEAGVDNNYQLLWGGLKHQNAVQNGKFPGFVVFPQEPYGSWAQVPNFAPNQLSTALSQTLEMIDSLILRYNIDPDRVFIHGLSSGGTGVFASVYNRPDLFAGYLPMSASSDPTQAYKLSSIPIWLFQGGTDDNPVPSVSHTWLDALHNAGANNAALTKYTEYANTGHYVWDKAYDDLDFFPFMMRQNKRKMYLLGSNPIPSGGATNLGIASGQGAYQWCKDGVPIPNATSFRLDGINQSGSYFVKFKRKASDVSWVNSDTIAITGGGVAGAPVIQLTTPVANAKYAEPATIAFAANSYDLDGTVTKVEFYNGNTLLGTDNTAPYQFSWTNVPLGVYSLSAKATDNSSISSTTSPIQVVVTGTTNLPPIVSITSPANNTNYPSSTHIAYNANASDPDGSVTKVDFYVDGGLVSSDTYPPYSTDIWSFTNGVHVLKVIATDNKNATASTTVNVTVGPITNTAPTVSLTSPSNNSSYTSPASVSMTATAADADGTVSKVEFFSGATWIGTATVSPYTFLWSNVAAGNYALTAKATDNLGAVTTSGSVSIAVSAPVNTAPTVSLTTPVNNATFTAPASVSLAATAADVDGTISKVEFFSGTILIGTSTVSPYVFTWSNVASGTYTLSSKATDNLGAVTTSNLVSILVTGPSNVAPTVSLTSPSNGATFTAPASVSFTATAADADGSVSKVDFYSGATLLGTDVTSPYQFTWSNVAAGSYTLSAKATDDLGAVTTSGTVDITVSAPVNVAPTVSLTSPSNSATFTSPASVSLAAMAADADGSVSKVDFYSGATLVGTDVTSPYQFTWSNVAAGNYTLSAKATDDLGAVTTSSTVGITVSAPVNVSPTISLTSPSNGATFTEPASVSLAATATDADGSVSKVDFYSGATLLGTDVTSPYQFTWPNVAAGSYTLSAKATDDLGAVTTSTSVSIVVNSVGTQLPLVTITSPINNASFIAPNSFGIAASVSDPGRSISKVEFYLGASLVGTDNYPPYTANVWNLDIGSYTITVNATDNLGFIGTSSIQLEMTDASEYFTTSASCFTAGTSVSFQITGSPIVNAVNYGWWFTGQGASVNYSTGTGGYIATVLPSASVTNGQVCVGVTYANNSYRQFCKVMNKCVGAREDDAPAEQTTVISNNGTSGNFSLKSTKDISSLTVITLTGSVVYSSKGIPSGQQVNLGTAVPNGMHVVQISYSDGSSEIKKIHRVE